MNRLLIVLCAMFTPFMMFSKFTWPWPKQASKAFKWSHPSRFFVNRCTIFAPGVLHDESAIIQFCKTFKTLNGEVLESKTGIELIDSNHCCTCNFSEVVIPEQSLENPKHKVFSKGVLPRLFYRLGTRLRHWRHRKKFGPEPNHRPKKFHLDLTRLNIAQESDQLILAEAYDKNIRPRRRNIIVIYGFSRGAATTFNFMARKYKQQKKQCVKAVILQGCFDSIDNTMGRLKRGFLNRMLPNFSDAHNQRQEPIHVVRDFPRDIPVLFITSERDELVPYKSTCALAHALRNSGHSNVYLLILKESPHSRYTSHNEKDTHTVECVVHAFYKKYKVSYIGTLAKGGKEMLEECKLV
jgi:predicted esterase